MFNVFLDIYYNINLENLLFIFFRGKNIIIFWIWGIFFQIIMVTDKRANIASLFKMHFWRSNVFWVRVFVDIYWDFLLHNFVLSLPISIQVASIASLIFSGKRCILFNRDRQIYDGLFLPHLIFNLSPINELYLVLVYFFSLFYYTFPSLNPLNMRPYLLFSLFFLPHLNNNLFLFLFILFKIL